MLTVRQQQQRPKHLEKELGKGVSDLSVINFLDGFIGADKRRHSQRSQQDSSDSPNAAICLRMSQQGSKCNRIGQECKIYASVIWLPSSS